MIFNFYDTCSLLIKSSDLFETDEKFYFSSITLKELESIKEDKLKDPDVKFAARDFLRKLQLPENEDKYQVFVYKNSMISPIEDADLEINNDTKILATAIYVKNILDTNDELCFYTDDSQLYEISKLFFDSSHLNRVGELTDDYKGYIEVTMNDEDMVYYYSHLFENIYDLYVNQYLIIKNEQGEIIDTACWTGEEYRHLSYQNFNSTFFGPVKPMKDDLQQAMFADSLCHNKLTMIKGKPGAGKTYLSMAFLLNQLEKGKIDRIIVFCNTVATKNAAKLGYYPGSRDEKLLDSQIGNMLAAKLGSKMAVEQLIDQEALMLLPLADIRGYDTSGLKAGVYITEAQNLDINLLKTALQRIGEDSICIIDGDAKAQVDDISFAGSNNGMRRASKIFRGEDLYGEVELQKIHRSKIGEIADKM